MTQHGGSDGAGGAAPQKPVAPTARGWGPGEGDVLALLVAFGADLREAGLPVGPGDVLVYCQAVAALDPGDATDLYWAGRACLVHDRRDLPVYEDLFRDYFLAAGSPGSRLLGAGGADGTGSESQGTTGED